MSKKDTRRLDFIDAQRYTRWAGYSKLGGSCVWPVFPGESFRKAIDLAMQQQRRTRKAERARLRRVTA